MGEQRAAARGGSGAVASGGACGALRRSSDGANGCAAAAVALLLLLLAESGAAAAATSGGCPESFGSARQHVAAATSGVCSFDPAADCGRPRCSAHVPGTPWQWQAPRPTCTALPISAPLYKLCPFMPRLLQHHGRGSLLQPAEAAADPGLQLCFLSYQAAADPTIISDPTTPSGDAAETHFTLFLDRIRAADAAGAAAAAATPRHALYDFDAEWARMLRHLASEVAAAPKAIGQYAVGCTGLLCNSGCSAALSAAVWARSA